MNRTILILISVLIFIACTRNKTPEPVPGNGDQEFISAVDISSYPEIVNFDPVFYDPDGNQKNFLSILKGNGINTIRLRLWVNQANGHSGFDEVKEFSRALKMAGFDIWLTLHYSDTWADPGNQEVPLQWKDLDLNSLKDSVYNYTKKVVLAIQPDYIQIGNEINSGILHPYGNITTNYQGFMDLIRQGCIAVRENANSCKIILHFAGIVDSDWFFNQVSAIDYDIIGLSYYPVWHGKSLDTLKAKMQGLGETHNKKIVIAETAYPFTLEWNDWTNNIVGLNEQLILPEYPATPEGQQKFIRQIKTLTQEIENGTGFCYWGAELIAWKGNQSVCASPWENQALFDFNNKALPVLSEFGND
ncbi:MAG: glycoside hydrolase family 53 protein [Owenweeksia sp.]